MQEQFSSTPSMEIKNDNPGNDRPKNEKPLVGVSQCLLGDAVRYDGKSKTNEVVLTKLSQLFEFLPVCPEVEAGLGIPRPPVQLTASIERPRLTGRDDALIDVTDTMYAYCKHKPAELNKLAGFIFKSRSPSCGLQSTPVFINGECVSDTSSGVFAASLCQAYPDLIVIEECQLDDKNTLDRFIKGICDSKKP